MISCLHWFFPGKFKFQALPSEENLWTWYRDCRRYKYTKQFTGKDLLRNNEYIGSYDPHSELINEIKSIINVQ